MCDIHIIHKYYVYMMQFVLFLCDEILDMIWRRMLKNPFTCLYTELNLYHNDNIYILLLLLLLLYCVWNVNNCTEFPEDASTTIAMNFLVLQCCKQTFKKSC